MKRSIAALLMLLALSCAAHAFGLGLGNRFGKLGANSGAGVVVPQPTGKILLIDGTSFLLKLDGTSKLCRVGGC